MYILRHGILHSLLQIKSVLSVRSVELFTCMICLYPWAEHLHQCTEAGDRDPLFPMTTLLYKYTLKVGKQLWSWLASLHVEPLPCGELGQGNWAAVFSACSSESRGYLKRELVLSVMTMWNRIPVTWRLQGVGEVGEKHQKPTPLWSNCSSRGLGLRREETPSSWLLG